MESNGTGNGPSAEPRLATGAASAAESMVAKSTRSPRSEPVKRAKRGEPVLSDSDVLAILENALKLVSKRWEPVGVSVPTIDTGKVSLTLPKQVDFCPRCRHLRPKSEMSEGRCLKCGHALANTTP